MTNWKTTCLATAILSLLVACSDQSTHSSVEFVASWTDPTIHTAKSYWYSGETDDYYQIIEKWPGRSITYHVDKGTVLLVGVAPFAAGSDLADVNLKSVHVKLLGATD